MKKSFIVFGLLIAFILPLLAQGHASPLSYNPRSGEVIESPPDKITIHFSERIEQEASSILAFGPGNVRIDDGQGRVEFDGRFFSVGLSKGRNGTYTVSWQVISADDGHFTKGAYSFFVGRSEEPVKHSEATFQVVHSSTMLESWIIWIEMLGQSILVGSVAISIFVFRGIRKRLGPIPDDCCRKLDFLNYMGAYLIIIGMVSYLVQEAIQLKTLQGISLLDSFHDISFTTSGFYALVRLSIAAMFVLFFSTTETTVDNRGSVRKEYFLALFLAIMLLIRARVSHAAASEFMPSLSVFINFVHLIFKELWIGGLIAFIFLFRSAFSNYDTKLIGLSSVLFSRILTFCFALGGVTGVYIVWLHLKAPSNIFGTDWGVRFLLLTVFAFFLLGLRLYHHFVLDRRLSRKGFDPSDSYEVALCKLVIKAEVVIGLIVLFISSLLVITTPPLHHTTPFSKTALSYDMHIALKEGNVPDSLSILFEGGDTMQIKEVAVALDGEDDSIGSVPVKAERVSSNEYSFRKSAFTSSGVWKVEVTAFRENAYDAMATFDVSYPNDLERSSEKPSLSFGKFELANLSIAVLMIFFSVIMHRYNSRLLKDYG